MSLTKLFNFEYLKQNIKKSKGILLTLILIIPVITVLVLISANKSEYDCLVNESTYNMINIIGMYVFPVLLSIILSGYVYKRNSVDFINSMPMNRKTIYITNFIGGLLIILLTQVLTLIAGIGCHNVFNDVFLPLGMVVDSFIVMTISYIFVYATTLLAMTLSGNVLTQIVITALILFLVPFSDMIFSFSKEMDADIISISYDDKVTAISNEEFKEYTMPFNIVGRFYYGTRTDFYSVVSMSKMAVLSIVYLIIGMKLFEKRKMENIGTSFASTKAHYIVKGLTMVPMVFLASLMSVRDEYLLIAITLMFIYYIVYDFILNKKSNIKYTIGFFIVTVVALEGIFQAGKFIVNHEKIENITADDISGIAVSNFDQYSIVNESIKSNKHLDILVEDRTLINKYIANVKDTQYYMMRSEKEYKEDKGKKAYIQTRIKLKNGKDIYSKVYLDYYVYEELIDYINKNYSEEVKALYDYDEIGISSYFELLPDDIVKRIDEILKEKNYRTYAEKSYPTSANTQIYIYDNHSMKETRLDINVDKEIFAIITGFFNEETYAEISKIQELDTINVEVVRMVLTDEYDRIYSAVDTTPKLIDYIKNHYKDKCDMDKETVEINFYGTGDSTFYANLTDELRAILKEANWEEELPKDEEVSTLKQ